MLRVFAVHDSKAEAYLRPFFAETRGLAIRSFMQAVNDRESPFNKYPGDFTLFEIGRYDEATGVVAPVDHYNCGVAISFITKGEV